MPGRQPGDAEERDLYQWVRTVLTVRALQAKRTFALSDNLSVVEFDEEGRQRNNLRANPDYSSVLMDW